MSFVAFSVQSGVGYNPLNDNLAKKYHAEEIKGMDSYSMAVMKGETIIICCILLRQFPQRWLDHLYVTCFRQHCGDFVQNYMLADNWKMPRIQQMPNKTTGSCKYNERFACQSFNSAWTGIQNAKIYPIRTFLA